MIDNLREQIQQRIDELSAEADRLRAALTALGSSAASQPARAAERLTGSARRERGTGGRASQSRRTRQPAAETDTETPARRRSTGTRVAVLEALRGGEAMTASQVAEQTGLGRASVSTTLSKLAKSGEVHKAQRGYQIADQRNGAGPQAS
jgi:DNA-binding transcriptional ArsR family regulator